MDTTKLKVSLGRTYNMGNYESLRIDVGFTDKGADYSSSVEVQQTYDKIFKLCEAALRKERDKLLKALDRKD